METHKRNLSVRLATLFGVGRLPQAPGTWGTLAALPLVFVFQWIHSPWGMFVLVAFVIFSIAIVERALKQFDQDDPQEIVIDEVCGYLITMFGHTPYWYVLLLGFVFFRLADIFKFAPARWIEAKKGGLGVVLDDVIAGFYASFFLFVLQWLGL